MKKFYFHDLLKFFILLCIFLIGYVIFINTAKNDSSINNTVSSYQVKTSNIIKKIGYNDTVDTFFRVNKDFIFQTSKNNVSKEILLETKSDNYFDYKAQQKMEKDFGLEQMIRLNVVGDKNTKFTRRPSYGVSINSKVKQLRVNGKKADQVFDYKYNGNIFYLWYFKDFEIDLDNVNTEDNWKKILITFS